MKKEWAILLLSIGGSGSLSAQNYLAYSKASTMLLDSGHVTIQHVEKGDVLILETKKPLVGYVAATHMRTKQRGLLPSHHVKVERSIDGIDSMVSLRSDEIKDPILKIHNSSKHPMVFKMAGQEIELEPNEQKRIQVKAGKSYYKVSAHDVDYHYGSEVLEEYRQYEWEFYIEEE